MDAEHMKRLLAKARASKQEIPASPEATVPVEPPPDSALARLRAKIAAAKAAKSFTVHIPADSKPGQKIPVTVPKGSSLSDAVFKQIPPTDSSKPLAVAVKQALQHTDKYGNTITYNELQEEFVHLASAGENCILIGAAGTGKTTCMQGTVQHLIQSGAAGILRADAHKYLRDGTPGVVVISYTRRAVNNIRRAMPDDMKNNCITIHKLLEYGPVFYEYYDEEAGTMKKTMQFEPSRHAGNPLPSSIHTIILEESSMASLELYKQLIDALGHKVQWIFLGDINQLPPVFGSAILGYKLLQWNVIELTEVYRQALESPIIRLAHRILSGKPIPVAEFDDFKVPNQLTLHAWKKRLKDDVALMTLAAFFTRAIDEHAYNVDSDMILMPFNKACGTIELNKHIANHLARKYERTTYEVMAGFNKLYFSPGDKVLYDKEDAEIISIGINAGYAGGRVQQESKTLDYWGYNKNAAAERANSIHGNELDIDELLAAAAATDDRVRQASHIITLRLLDTMDEISINSAAEVNALIHAYAITVHKAQGSEWKKVFLTLHQSHSTMLQRELLYTAVTRAKEELYVICEPDSMEKGIRKQKIVGNTLEAKAEFFKGKLDAIDDELLAYIHRG